MNHHDDAQLPKSRFQKICNVLMASCLGVMAVAVFINVLLRYGFGSGIAASEELSRLLFVWMVVIGATAAYPAGEHMAFTALVGSLRDRPKRLAATSALRNVASGREIAVFIETIITMSYPCDILRT